MKLASDIYIHTSTYSDLGNSKYPFQIHVAFFCMIILSLWWVVYGFIFSYIYLKKGKTFAFKILDS